jgi:hypothetical protein
MKMRVPYDLLLQNLKQDPAFTFYEKIVIEHKR